MLKERMVIDYVVLILDELHRCRQATGTELATRLQESCNSSTYMRKILSRMSSLKLVTPNGIDGFTLTKGYDEYTLGDVLGAASAEALHESPASRAEDYLRKAADNLKLKDLR